MKIGLSDGKDFTGNEIIAYHLNADFNFANPYLLYQRGTNQNTNCLTRQYFQKTETLRPLKIIK